MCMLRTPWSDLCRKGEALVNAEKWFRQLEFPLIGKNSWEWIKTRKQQSLYDNNSDSDSDSDSDRDSESDSNSDRDSESDSNSDRDSNSSSNSSNNSNDNDNPWRKEVYIMHCDCVLSTNRMELPLQQPCIHSSCIRYKLVRP